MDIRHTVATLSLDAIKAVIVLLSVSQEMGRNKDVWRYEVETIDVPGFWDKQIDLFFSPLDSPAQVSIPHN